MRNFNIENKAAVALVDYLLAQNIPFKADRKAGAVCVRFTVQAAYFGAICLHCTTSIETKVHEC